jgi:hypothetical protein
MSVYFLASRTLLLLALIILITAACWGWANNTSAKPVPEQAQLEKYASKKPGATTTAFFIVSIFLGTIVVGFSIWLEYMRVRDAREALREDLLPDPPDLSSSRG